MNYRSSPYFFLVFSPADVFGLGLITSLSQKFPASRADTVEFLVPLLCVSVLLLLSCLQAFCHKSHSKQKVVWRASGRGVEEQCVCVCERRRVGGGGQSAYHAQQINEAVSIGL